jgi:ABC-type antimicrobial peptide transport system permease subunit
MGKADEIGYEFFKVYAKRRFGPPYWMRTGLSPALLGSYLVVALRKLKRHKGYSLINVAGLAVGLACCALMMLWVRHEKSFDRFHVNRDSIYRVIKKTANNGTAMLDARTPYPLGPAILGKVPEVKAICRFQGYEGRDLKYGDQTFILTDNYGTADPSFFEIFSFPFVQGDPRTALAEKGSIVLSEKAAHKIFGNEPPLGKILTKAGGWGDFKVTGVMRDIPENSHIKIDSVVPIKFDAPGRDVGENDWKPLFYYTYVQLAPNSTAASAGPKIAAVLNENAKGLNAEVILQHLRDVHLKSNFQWDLDNYAQGSQSTLTIFTLAALGILLLAMINFMNLSTARSANRAKEVGLRKVSGARRTDVMGQFLGESVLLGFLGLIIAMGLVSLALPLFNRLAGRAIAPSELLAPSVLLGLTAAAFLTGLLSGFYPSLFLSAFQPARVLKGGAVSGGRAQAALRKGLVVIQFALTLFFVMGTAVVSRQLAFVRGKDLGIDTHNVVIGGFFGRDFQPLKNALLANPNVLSVTRSSPPQKEQRGLSAVTWEGKSEGDQSQFFPVIVDPDFLTTFRIGMVEGRFFSNEFPTDTTQAVVLNQTAARAMGMASPLGKRITIARQTFTVIGVIKDFHQSSLHRPIEPMILRWPEFHWDMCVRIKPANAAETISFLKATQSRFDSEPDYPFFRFEFLDDRIRGFYTEERKVEGVMGLFTGIALFTACLGLLGLASFLAEKRTKEIGVRRILGAPVTSLVYLQTKEFSLWILVSGLAAAPAAYFAAARWLRGFAYRLTPGPSLFILSILAVMVIALLAVAYQSIRAARANPVVSLRHE